MAPLQLVRVLIQSQQPRFCGGLEGGNQAVDGCISLC